ncbi:ASCH domain-containing protein [Sedimentibacter sp. MB31-C6]|uniref:ASCH domain-containing protein n=1 Tax=Sedimentibacter sp. MB31-C6 TaxID=3109366 RepID=UPI002DDD6EF1|nr:ASCH domain-containing protein [Sedimentibacter sp. MB36-C1]WSI04570.1 ASCH domain-containing protein [Sedimentibacter sp. MB36-C1]
MKKESVEKMWTNYLETLGEKPNNTNRTYESWYFCDNKQDADELAELVFNGTKKATASLYLYYSSENEELPKVGDLSIITNWEGEAKCIIRTSNIDIVPFKNVTEEFAATEGEGDKSLEYWKRCHKDYFSREIKELGKEFNEDILVVCEKFEVVYK